MRLRAIEILPFPAVRRLFAALTILALASVVQADTPSAATHPAGATTQTATAQAQTEPASTEQPSSLTIAPDMPVRPALDEAQTRGALWQMFASMLVILVLGAGAIIIIKKVLPRFGPLAGKTGWIAPQGGRLRVADTVHLGQHRRAHLLEVEGRRFLVGSTQNNITLIAELPAAPATKEDK